jgi:hypothetical protein
VARARHLLEQRNVGLLWLTQCRNFCGKRKDKQWLGNTAAQDRKDAAVEPAMSR